MRIPAVRTLAGSPAFRATNQPTAAHLIALAVSRAAGERLRFTPAPARPSAGLARRCRLGGVNVV